VATSNTFATPILSQTALTTSNYTTATALANNTIYYWRVRAKNSLGNSTWSTVWSFTTVPVVPPMPSVPTLLLPANNATNVVASPVFDWSDATATNTYHIQVSTSNTFANMVVNDSSTTLSTFTPSLALILNTTYFWRVRAKGTGGTSAWSSVWSFKTENPNSVEENKATSFKIYPNPFTDFIQVEKENESGTIVLFDMQGRKILEQETAIATKLNTENLDAGSYIIMLQTNTGNVSKQIIKTK